jgi:hypothetical protein
MRQYEEGFDCNLIDTIFPHSVTFFEELVCERPGQRSAPAAGLAGR